MAVPMKLPSTVLPVAPAALINTPKALLPEMIFRSIARCSPADRVARCIVNYYAVGTVAQVCGTVDIGADEVAEYRVACGGVT